jgi:hypothetical protein
MEEFVSLLPTSHEVLGISTVGNGLWNDGGTDPDVSLPASKYQNVPYYVRGLRKQVGNT